MVRGKFQSTLPRRERHSHDISHAFLWHNFNPRSREGSDLNAAVKSSGSNFNFNPRSREGSDRSVRWGSRPEWYFNPRSREGSDLYQLSHMAILL